MIEIEITDFKYSPALRELLVKYVSRQYEESAEFDDYHLIAEYNYLKNNNELHLLFEEEWFTTYMNDDQHNG